MRRAIAWLTCSAPAFAAPAAASPDATGLVDPFAGTANQGNTFPGAALPFGMVQVSPDDGYYLGFDPRQRHDPRLQPDAPLGRRLRDPLTATTRRAGSATRSRRPTRPT
jgi:hypothetical protein